MITCYRSHLLREPGNSIDPSYIFLPFSSRLPDFRSLCGKYCRCCGRAPCGTWCFLQAGNVNKSSEVQGPVHPGYLLYLSDEQLPSYDRDLFLSPIWLITTRRLRLWVPCVGYEKLPRFFLIMKRHYFWIPINQPVFNGMSRKVVIPARFIHDLRRLFGMFHSNFV